MEQLPLWFRLLLLLVSVLLDIQLCCQNMPLGMHAFIHLTYPVCQIQLSVTFSIHLQQLYMCIIYEVSYFNLYTIFCHVSLSFMLEPLNFKVKHDCYKFSVLSWLQMDLLLATDGCRMWTIYKWRGFEYMGILFCKYPSLSLSYVHASLYLFQSSSLLSGHLKWCRLASPWHDYLLWMGHGNL